MKKYLLVFCLSIATNLCYSQKFAYGLHVGYVRTVYSFPVKSDDYNSADIAPFYSPSLAMSIHFLALKSFRIGTGIQYLSISGAKDAGQVPGNFGNPNSKGRLLFNIDNSYLIFPVDFLVILSHQARVKPVLSAGINFFVPLLQSISLQVAPETINSFYPTVETTIDKNTPNQYFGFYIGSGFILPISHHELVLLLKYKSNTSRYTIKNAFLADPEKHEIKFNMIELSLGWNFIGKD